MLTESEQFVTAIKLRELGLQREQALATYARIAGLLDAAAAPRDRIALLYEHLRQLTFAKQPLHPSITNMTLLSDAGTPASPEITGWWAAQLERELASGQLRAELVSLFGALFQEWLEHPPVLQSNPGQTAALAEPIIRAAPATDHQAALDAVFGLWRDPEEQAALDKKIAAAPAAIDSDELRTILRRIAKDPFYSQATRDEARSLLNDSLMLKELTDALAIMLDQQSAWRWPEAGVPAEAQWARTRWRLFLREDLVTACFHQVIAAHWEKVFGNFCSTADIIPLKALKRLAKRGRHADLNAIIANFYGAAKGVNIWRVPPDRDPAAALGDDPGQLERYGSHYSIFSVRASKIGKLRQWSQLGDYDGEYDHNLEIALRVINAELQIGARAYPDRPIYLLKTDFRDYYPSLRHDLILDILRRIGLRPEQIAFFARYLDVPLDLDGRRERQRVGVPNHRPISDMFGELVLRLTEMFIERHAHVQIVRFVDDLTLIASDPGELVKAWQALQDWCAACGLALNLDKTGAIAIRGTLPAGLPQTPPRWLFVTIDQSGTWGLDDAAIGDFVDQTIRAMEKTPAILSKIVVYNGCCAYLNQAIGLRVDLGPAHREQVRATLWRYAQQLTEQGGIVDHIRGLIGQRFGSAVELPEGWFHWPITAGGLGIQQPLIIAHSYQDAWQAREAPAVPTERDEWWQQSANGWLTFYEHWLAALEASEPEANSVLASLTNDFIARGGEVRGSAQIGLSGYWRWVLALYGPQILERCGSFRFLFTELVPLQLISRKATSKIQVPAE